MNLRIPLLMCVVVATAALVLVPTPQPARAAVATAVPTSGWLTQGFGGCSVEGQCHAAVDIAGPNVLPGSPVYAMSDGVVVQRIMMNGSYGCYLVIDHGDQGAGQNLFSLYSHLGWEDAPDHTAGCYFDVALGQSVTRGQKIGNQGDAGKATGVHLHFGVYLYPGPWSGSHHAFNPTACIGTAASYTALAAGVSCGAETCPQAVADWCLIRAVPSTNIYMLFGGAKFHVPDSSVLASLYPGRPVWDVSDAYADSLPDVPRDGTLLLDSSDGRVYVIIGGAKFHIPDETTLRNLYCPSHPWPTCYGNMWHGAITGMPGTPANGTLLHDVSDGKVYVILGGARFHVPTEAILRDLYCPSYPQPECFQDIWHDAAGALPTIPVDDTLLIESGNTAVYAMCQGSRWRIPNPTVFDQLGYSWSAIGSLWQGALSAFPVDANSDVALLPPGDRQCDRVDADDDNDGLTDVDESSVYDTNPLNPDTDNDTKLDGVDNCANWSNAAQALPVWPVASGDTDCDGFSHAREAAIGTSPARQCPATATPNDEAIDSWPSDIDDNRTTNLVDILLMGPSYNKQSFDPGYSPRFDLNADGKVNMNDLLLFGPYYNKSCS